MSRQPMPKPKFNIELSNRQSSYRPDRRRLIALARHVLAAESVAAADVEIAVVGDAEIAELNARYLARRGPTDVLSFDLSEVAERKVAQIIVSADTARRRARELGHSILAELGLYIAHGLLHLLDYDDQTQSARRRMHARQRELIERFGLRLKE